MLADTVFLGSFSTLCLLGAGLAWIDIRDGIIPDWLNLSVAGLGLAKVVIVGGLVAGIEATGEGAAIGLIFWLLRRLYFEWRKIQGLGLGDVKFLAAAGIWIGIAGLPMLLLFAALTALAAAGSHATGRARHDTPDFAAIRAVFGARPAIGAGHSTNHGRDMSSRGRDAGASR